MGFELTRGCPRGGSPESILSQFPPLGKANNHQTKRFGVLIFNP
ncbi:MAG: hypothetical protein WCS96_04625 [Victivallales bacterium]